MHYSHAAAHQPTDAVPMPTATELALIAAQFLRVDREQSEHSEAAYDLATETAYRLWCACRDKLKSKAEVKPGATELTRLARLKQMAALGVREPEAYPVTLKEFLTLTACPGRSHPDRLAKYRAWKRSQHESGDISKFEDPDGFFAFAGRAIEFATWLKVQRSETAKRARASRNSPQTA